MEIYPTRLQLRDEIAHWNMAPAPNEHTSNGIKAFEFQVPASGTCKSPMASCHCADAQHWNSRDISLPPRPRPCTPLVLCVCRGAVQSIIYTYVSYSLHRELASPAGVRSAVMCVCRRAVQSIRRSSEATSDGQIDHGQVKKPAFPGKNRSHGQTGHLAI